MEKHSRSDEMQGLHVAAGPEMPPGCRCRYRYWMIALALVAVLLLAPPAAASTPQPGNQAPALIETLDYVLKWTAIPVGRATVTSRKTRLDGRELWHFSITASTNALVDPFYKVRDQVDAYADLELRRSLHYHQQQHEGSYQRELEVRLDQANHRATRKRRGEQPGSIDIFPDSYDPLSAFFAFRRKALEPGMSLSAPITDGNKCVIGVVHVIERQRIHVAAGTFDTLLVKPDLHHVDGIVRKAKDAEIKLWITDDARHLPVKMESKVIVGHFAGELIAVEVAPAEGSGQNEQP